MSDTREATLAKHKIIADIYGRAYAATLGRGSGWIPEAEAKKAVIAFIKMMKTLDAPEWMWYETENL